MKYLYMLIVSTMISSLYGQGDLTYQLPHDDILSLADASPAPLIRIDDDAKNGFLFKRNMYKTIEDLSAKELRLAGLRIDPNTTMSSRMNYTFEVHHLEIETGKQTPIKGLPVRGNYAKMQWSHDQQKMALLNVTESGAELWVIDVNTKSAKRLGEFHVHGSLGNTMVWMKDDQSLLVKVNTGSSKNLIDRAISIPTGPTISENDGQKAQNRTYQDLLKNPIDEGNFIQVAQSELWKVTLDGTSRKVLDADMYDDLYLSPDGNYILVSKLKKPFSYLVPYYRFPYEYIVYDQNMNKVKKVFDIPLTEEIPSGFMAVSTHPRRIGWRADHPSTLYWVEALDDGDPEKEVDFRDAVYQLDAPFDGVKELIFKSKERFSSINWCTEDFAIAYEYWWNTRNVRTLAFDPSNPSNAPTLINERNYQDRYNDPGVFVSKRNQFGRSVLHKEDNLLYLIGDGYTDSGKFPFVDQYDLKTSETKRLFQVEDNDKLEDFAYSIDMEAGTILSRIESKNEYPNYYIRNIKTGSLKSVTTFENPFEAINAVHKEVITYKRDDGVELSATLYLPVGYNKNKKEKMPMVMWAYPREFKDKSSAGQTTNNSNEFTFPYYGSPIYWVNRGYVVLDDAAFPIVGEEDEEPNDTFIPQLVANAKAAIDAVDKLGYIDRNRVAVGGHSYGAFMTANLLSHSDLFAAGIARSGAYNRTLTPFGFQSEERIFNLRFCFCDILF